MQPSNSTQTNSNDKLTTTVSPVEQSGSFKNDSSKSKTKRFLLSDVNNLSAAHAREAFAFDNLYETHLCCEGEEAFVLFIEVGCSHYIVTLKNLETFKKAVVLSGQYEGMGALKAALKEKCRQLNTLTESEIDALIDSASTSEKFESLEKGAQFQVTFPNGKTVNAIKTDADKFSFQWFGQFKTERLADDLLIDFEFPTHTPFMFVQDPYNQNKQYIIKRVSFNEVIVFQLIGGEQCGRAKFTDGQLLVTYDFISESALDGLLQSDFSKSSQRLYMFKQEDVKSNWRLNVRRHMQFAQCIGMTIHSVNERKITRPL